MLRCKNEDYFGFEIQGINNAKTKDEQIEVLEKHLLKLESMTNEATSDIEDRIARLRHPHLFED